MENKLIIYKIEMFDLIRRKTEIICLAEYNLIKIYFY